MMFTTARSIGVAAVLFCAAAAALAAGATSTLATAAVIRLSAAQVHAAGIKLDVARAAAAQVQSSDLGAGLRLMGQVVTSPNETGVVLSAVAGHLEQVYVHIGATVGAGQPLARVHSAELASMQREFLHARATAELAQSRLERDETLFKEGIISETRLREARAARQMALASRQEQHRLLQLAGYSDKEIESLAPDSISSTVTLRAPNGGIVLEQPVQVGQHIEAGTTLFRLASPGKWWLELEASRTQAIDVHVGDIVRVVACRAPGRVIAIGTQLRSASQTLPIRAEIPDGSACLRPNQYIEADVLQAATAAGLVTIPASALVRSGAGEFVFVEKDGQFRPTPVVVTRRDGQQAVLRTGVQAGDRVASSGLVTLKGAWLGLGPQPTEPGAR